MSIHITALIQKEEDWYVSKCLENNIASQGKTIEEAMANLKEALELSAPNGNRKGILTMSNKDLCIKLINSFEEEQLGSVVLLLQSVKNLVDESFDEAYCLQLMKNYENDSDPDKGETMSISDFSKELGIDLK